MASDNFPPAWKAGYVYDRDALVTHGLCRRGVVQMQRRAVGPQELAAQRRWRSGVFTVRESCLPGDIGHPWATRRGLGDPISVGDPGMG